MDPGLERLPCSAGEHIADHHSTCSEPQTSVARIAINGGPYLRHACAEVVRDFQARHLDANIILVDQPENGGQSSARNRGACMARGDLIAFLDQDDVWYAKHLEHLVKPFIDQPPGQPLGWVYSDLDEAEENGHVIHQVSDDPACPTPSKKQSISMS